MNVQTEVNEQRGLKKRPPVTKCNDVQRMDNLYKRPLKSLTWKYFDGLLSQLFLPKLPLILI